MVAAEAEEEEAAAYSLEVVWPVDAAVSEKQPLSHINIRLQALLGFPVLEVVLLESPAAQPDLRVPAPRRCLEVGHRSHPPLRAGLVAFWPRFRREAGMGGEGPNLEEHPSPRPL